MKCRNVEELSEGMVDDYLDFCERALLGSEEGVETGERWSVYYVGVTSKVDRYVGGQKVLASYFPLGVGHTDRDPGVAVEQERRKLGGTLPKEDDGDERPLRPGELYPIYNSRDVLGSLPEDYEVVLGRGARWVRVPTEYVSGVVEKFERRVVRWWKVEKRRSST